MQVARFEYLVRTQAWIQASWLIRTNLKADTPQLDSRSRWSWSRIQSYIVVLPLPRHFLLSRLFDMHNICIVHVWCRIEEVSRSDLADAAEKRIKRRCSRKRIVVLVAFRILLYLCSSQRSRESLRRSFLAAAAPRRVRSFERCPSPRVTRSLVRHDEQVKVAPPRTWSVYVSYIAYVSTNSPPLSLPAVLLRVALRVLRLPCARM